MNQPYAELRESLAELPHISEAQVDQWVNLQETIDKSRDYLVLAVPEAQNSVEQAQRILEQQTYTLVFFGGTGVGKSTLINGLLGRNLLPTGAVTAVTGTIVYIEQAEEGEIESLTLTYWTKEEFADRVIQLCDLAQVARFDITNGAEREQGKYDIEQLIVSHQDAAKTERDEYLEILIDCIESYENHSQLYKVDAPLPQTYDLSDEEGMTHLREDGYKGSDKRQIRLVKSATYRIQPRDGVPNLLMNGYLRIVDVPGLGAGMRLHEEITLEEMKKKDAMIVMVSDAGRQRVDEMKSMAAVQWIKDNRLFGLRGADLDAAAAKIFMVVNGANVRQAYDRLMSDDPQSEREVRELLRHIAPNYWENYRHRSENRPYFFVMAPPALYVQDPENAPAEFASETERIMKAFADKLDGLDPESDPLSDAAKEALLELSELPALRASLVDFIQNERIDTQLREASTRVRQAIFGLRSHYEGQLSERGVYPPFDISWETLQQKRYENLLNRLRKELPRVFHTALIDLSQRTNDETRFRSLLQPSLNNVKTMVEDSIEREIETLLDNYGTEYWDDRDVTYDNLIWGTSGIELPIKRILYQVELVMQEAVSRFMPSVADVVVRELERTLQSHDLMSRMERYEYGQAYVYGLPVVPGETFDVTAACRQLISQIEANFRKVCEHAALYELMKPERSIHAKLAAGDALALPTNERLLDIALNGPQAVRDDIQAAAQAVGSPNGTAPAPAAVAEASDDGFDIKILDVNSAPADDISISFPSDPNGIAVPGIGSVDMERSYADKLDDVASKANRLFGQIVDDLFSDDELLPRLRRLFWVEASRVEQQFNNHIVKPMLRQHDRNINDEGLMAAMEIDLESVSDIERMMRVWEGLSELENEMLV